jgi:uncharacterized repeat protein (TIGR02543 family)
MRVMRWTTRLSFFLSVIFVLALCSGATTEDNTTYELLKAVDDVTEAGEVAVFHGLELIAVSDDGIARFATDDPDLHRALLGEGFARNATSRHMFGPPGSDKDPYLSDQYHIPLMSIDDAWSVTEGSADVTIAIIDSGIDTDNPEFSGRISPLSHNARTGQTGLSHIEDTDGHGTMVAGIIGANKSNREGIAGILSNASLLVIKASNEEGTYDDADLISAIRYAADNGADVINMSLGGPYANPLTEDAIDYALSKGAVVVAASGNDGDSELLYPASFPQTLSVGAVDSTKTIADYSNRNNMVDVVAPGSGIVTTYTGGQYMVGSGTSFAAPMVSGVLGLIFSADPQLTAEDAIGRIRVTATDLGDPGKDDVYGYGFTDALDALSLEVVTVSFDTDGGTQIPSISVAAGVPFDVPSATKGYHTFDGWYMDSALTDAFVPGVTTVSADTTLYAKFTPIDMTVTFVTDGDPVDPVLVPYGTALVPPEATKEGHSFDGWYLSESFRLSYNGETVTSDMTLYAKFTPLEHVVSFESVGSLPEAIEVSYGAEISLPSSDLEGYRFLGWTAPSLEDGPVMELVVTGDITLTAVFEGATSLTVTYDDGTGVTQAVEVFAGDVLDTPSRDINGQDFLGWFYDPSGVTPYMDEPVFEDLTLYGLFSPSVHTVIVYGADMVTVARTYEVPHGDSLDPDLVIERDPSPSVIYTFTGWDTQLGVITDDLEVRPVFDYAYIEGTIVLSPGIDSVDAGSQWNDAGLVMEDPYLFVEVVTSLDPDMPGTYLVTYHVMVDGFPLTTLRRMVMVREPAVPIVITLRPDITTLVEGETYADAGATTNTGTLTSSGTVDTSVPGTYVITYAAREGNRQATRTKMVHVLEKPVEEPTLDMPSKKEGWWL